MKAREWYRFQSKANDTTAEIFVYDEIGAPSFFNEHAVSAKQFIEELKALPESTTSIAVHINSPGGDAFDAVAIANALRDQIAKGRTVDTFVDGLAASAATIVAMAGSTVTMADNALFMVHNPFSLEFGTADDMRKTAEALDAVRDTIVATYQWHSPLDAAALSELMTAETWMDADEAIENGFATAKIVGLHAAASIDPRSTAKLKVPEKFQARVDALLKKDEQPKPAPTPVVASAIDVLSAVDAAGLGTGFATELIKASLPMEQVTAKVDAAKQAKAQAAGRVVDIRALCETAKQPALADVLIASAVTTADVKALLTAVTAAQDKVEIDAKLLPDRKTPSDSGLSIVDAYAKLNRPVTKG